MFDALRTVVKSVLRDGERDDSYRRVKGHVRISRWTGHAYEDPGMRWLSGRSLAAQIGSR